jgi:hypothetical protein
MQNKLTAINNKVTEIEVTVHIPDNVPEHIKQSKINIIYDILNPKIIIEKLLK